MKNDVTGAEKQLALVENLLEKVESPIAYAETEREKTGKLIIEGNDALAEEAYARALQTYDDLDPSIQSPMARFGLIRAGILTMAEKDNDIREAQKRMQDYSNLFKDHPHAYIAHVIRECRKKYPELEVAHVPAAAPVSTRLNQEFLCMEELRQDL
jgi:hypothetical protein